MVTVSFRDRARVRVRVRVSVMAIVSCGGGALSNGCLTWRA